VQWSVARSDVFHYVCVREGPLAYSSLFAAKRVSQEVLYGLELGLAARELIRLQVTFELELKVL
jgi:hypothetical protein